MEFIHKNQIYTDSNTNFKIIPPNVHKYVPNTDYISYINHLLQNLEVLSTGLNFTEPSKWLYALYFYCYKIHANLLIGVLLLED